MKELYSFEVPSATDWSFQQLQPQFKPNYFVDISSSFESKLIALGCYEDEARPFPHPRPPKALKATVRKWGSTVGVDYAEAFELVRCIR